MKISDADRKAFAAAIEGAKPLKPRDRVSPETARPKPVARKAREAAAEILSESIADPRSGVLGEEIGFRRPGVSEKTFRALRRGAFSVEDEIDLHGLRREAARRELKTFIAGAASRHLGCVRVIHGKGHRSGPDGPVLKASVQQWLVQWDVVLAFTTAERRHGGTGAVYVLLGEP